MLILKQEIEVSGTCIRGCRKSHAVSVSSCINFGDKKGVAFQSSLDPQFHSWIIEVFDLPSFSSESRKRYALRLLWICLEEGWEVGSFPALGNYLLGVEFTWKEVGRNWQFLNKQVRIQEVLIAERFAENFRERQLIRKGRKFLCSCLA